MVLGDFNGKVGKATLSTTVHGKFGLGERNERGSALIELCSTNNLLITNTLFEHHPRHQYTWTSPDGKTRNQIDYILISQKWRSYVKNVKTLPGADCNSDHQLLVANLKLKLAKLPKKTNVPIRYNYNSVSDGYSIAITNSVEALLMNEEEKTPDELWSDGKKALLASAKENFSKKK